MRDKADHEATAMMKAQFMSLWDGKQFVTNRVMMQDLSKHKVTFDTSENHPSIHNFYMSFCFSYKPTSSLHCIDFVR